jgi:hypothetical protein
MSKRLSYFCLAMGLCSFTTCALADEGAFAVQETNHAETSSLELSDIATALKPAPQTHIANPAPVIEKSIPSFTGKIKARKVRVRVSPDLESRVITELSKNDLLVVVGEKGDFYAVVAPKDMKAYVFRSFVLDGVIEGNRVNVRLEPSLDAPVIAHLNSGYHVGETLCSTNNKWYEITPPAEAHFYVAREYVDYVGGPELKAQYDKKRSVAEQLLSSASLLAKSEMQRPFNEIDLSQIKQNYEVILSDYKDFSDLAEKAQDALVAVQEEYLEKRITFLEEKANLKLGGNVDNLMAHFEPPSHSQKQPTDRMNLWQPIEESLFLTWSCRNDDRSIDDFYEEQRQSGLVVSGIVETYTAPVKNKPGDFIIRNKELPVAYVYSTQLNLQDYVGKKVSLLVSPRENNNFAFPAYFVLAVE